MKQLLYIYFASVLLISCNGGGLNEQQRKQVKEGKADRAIRKVTEAQIMEASLLKGKEITNSLSTPKDTSSSYFKAKWLYDSVTSPISKITQLQEAYLYSKENNQLLPAHVELYSADTLLYATPASFENNNGIWFIFMDKKSIVKSIN